MTNPTEHYLSIEEVKQLRQNTVLEALDVELVSIDDEQIVLKMTITNATRQPMGLLHGGISLLLAESAASIHSAWGINVAEKMPVGIEVNGSHLRSVAEGEVRVVGKQVRRSRSLAVHQVEIFHEESGKLLSTVRVTNFYKFFEG